MYVDCMKQRQIIISYKDYCTFLVWLVLVVVGFLAAVAGFLAAVFGFLAAAAGFFAADVVFLAADGFLAAGFLAVLVDPQPPLPQAPGIFLLFYQKKKNFY